MNLYLVQHGQALSKEQEPSRPLTDKGRSDVEKIAAFIDPLNLSVESICHSGKLRAAQTAEILSKTIISRQAISRREGLAPNDDVTSIAEQLAETNQDIMIVGHLPFLGKLAALLITGSQSTGATAFKQGGIVCLNRTEENNWLLAWMVTPELLS